MKTTSILMAGIAANFLVTSLGINAATVITKTNYHGWTEALWMRNPLAEVVVVPEIGRIMHLGLAGGENVIWENRALDGQKFDGRHKEWINLGGDKSWPSPEAEWGKYTGDASWFPPRGFDGLPATAAIEGGEVVLTSPVDPHYGIRVVRRLQLAADKPELTVRTIYERVRGNPAKIGVWIITQLHEPAGVYIPLPGKSQFAKGWIPLGKNSPPSLKLLPGERMLTLVRDRRDSFKIGSDAGTLIWVGEKTVVRIDSPRVAGEEYPDQGSSAEVYTNGGALDYVELEMLGPLREVRAGDTLSQTNVYTLRRRTETDPAKAAALMK